MTFASLEDFTAHHLPLLEQGLNTSVTTDDAAVGKHFGMMRYHLGFADEHLQPARAPTGKRIRPLLCLLAADAVGGDVSSAMPAALALEVLHNFSLVHDDIQDNSPTRRHRPTVWRLWGQAQAINVGDALFSLAHRLLLDLAECGVPAETVVEAVRLFDDTCLALTEGQFLDMDFERREAVSVAEYLRMIQDKTAALIALSCQLGALIGGGDEETCVLYRDFGQHLGITFQLQDDLLGIWGDEHQTGKSADSDIAQRKKTLPVIYALSQSGEASARLRLLYRQKIQAEDVPQVQTLLESTGAREETARRVEVELAEAMALLQRLHHEGMRVVLLRELASSLSQRRA